MPLTPETAIVPAPTQAPAGLALNSLPTGDPNAMMETASAIARAVAGVIERRKLFIEIKGNRHILIDGWLTLAAAAGCGLREVSVRELPDASYEATMELIRTSDGVVLARASAVCSMDEIRWRGQLRHARRAMALTRAAARTCRLSLAWIVKLGTDYSPVPAEEMDDAPPAQGPPPQAARLRPAAPVGDPATAHLVSELAKLVSAWKQLNPQGTRGDFSVWSGAVLNLDRPPVALTDWSVERVAHCLTAMEAEKRAAQSPAAPTADPDAPEPIMF